MNIIITQHHAINNKTVKHWINIEMNNTQWIFFYISIYFTVSKYKWIMELIEISF